MSSIADRRLKEPEQLNDDDDVCECDAPTISQTDCIQIECIENVYLIVYVGSEANVIVIMIFRFLKIIASNLMFHF